MRKGPTVRQSSNSVETAASQKKRQKKQNREKRRVKVKKKRPFRSVAKSFTVRKADMMILKYSGTSCQVQPSAAPVSHLPA